VEARLPDLRSRDSLLGTRLLNPHIPTDASDYVSFRLDEERRLAYTAMTRAASRVVWTASSDAANADAPSPSRFLDLVAPITRPTRPDRPLTPRSFEALLRRLTSDPCAPVIDRLAAVEVLARGTSVGLADPLTRYGTALPGTDSGIRPVHLKLSPTQATTYDTCPRQFAVQRYLLLRGAESNHLRFGSLIHKVLEVAEVTALEGGRERSSRVEAQQVLDDEWPDLGFGDDAVGRAWRARAEDTLDAMYALWPRSGAPVTLEHELNLVIAGTPWSGRADRIECRGDTLVVVDYKTGSQPARTADAATSLQLGYYLAAARDDDTVTPHGPVDGAEFWYPRAKPNKCSIVTRAFAPSELETVRRRLEDITAAISAESFDPLAGKHCDTCTVALVCPLRGPRREAFPR